MYRDNFSGSLVAQLFFPFWKWKQRDASIRTWKAKIKEISKMGSSSYSLQEKVLSAKKSGDEIQILTTNGTFGDKIEFHRISKMGPIWWENAMLWTKFEFPWPKAHMWWRNIFVANRSHFGMKLDSIA